MINIRNLQKIAPGFKITYDLDKNQIWFKSMSGKSIPEKEYYEMVLPSIRKEIGNGNISETFTEEIGFHFGVFLKK